MTAFDPFRPSGETVTVRHGDDLHAALEQSTDVWRPVQAIFVSADLYRVQGEMPDDEDWMFAPGSVVRCEKRKLSNGDGLAAVEAQAS